MAIHRARYTLAVIALVGLVGCQSNSGSTALSKANPFSSKTAASGSKTQYPPKPSTQVPNPTGTNAPMASGLAANPGATGPSSNYPATATSFNSLSAVPGGTGTAISGSYPSGSQLGTRAAGAGDPLVSPQQGYYPNSASSPTQRAGATPPAPSVTTNPYVPSDAGTARSAPATSGGFRSGARDYTSGATDYTASANANSNRGSAIVPRYGAAADRYGADASAATPAGADRLGSTARSGSGYDPIANARANSGAPFGPGNGYPSAAPAAGSRDSVSDPFRSGSRPSTPPGLSAPPTDRSPNPYSNAYSAAGASRPAGTSNDRGAAPNYPDYPATSAPPSSRSNSYNPPAGSNVPGNSNGYNPPASSYTPGSTGYNPPASSYTPGSTGYNPPASGYPPANSYPPASDYRPGDNGYNPPSTSPYRSPTGSTTPAAAPASDDDPHYRPGSTSDYVPRSSASSMARAPSDARIGGGVNPSGYGSGAGDYLR